MKLKVRRGCYGSQVFSLRNIRPGKIGGRRTGVWQVVDGEVYCVCYKCGAINQITGHTRLESGKVIIWFDGYMENCVTCIHCRGHFFLRLKGWKDPGLITCAHCDRTKIGRRRDLKGWKIKGNGDYYCPKCK